MTPHARQYLAVVGDIMIPFLLIVLIPVAGVAYVVDHNGKSRQYEASVAACHRGNALRVRLNDRDARYRAAFGEAANVLTNVGTTEAADRLAGVLRRAAEPAPPLPLTNCEAAFERPKWPWQ